MRCIHAAAVMHNIQELISYSQVSRSMRAPEFPSCQTNRCHGRKCRPSKRRCRCPPAASPVSPVIFAHRDIYSSTSTQVWYGDMLSVSTGAQMVTVRCQRCSVRTPANLPTKCYASATRNSQSCIKATCSWWQADCTSWSPTTEIKR